MSDPFSTSSDLLRRIHISPSKNPMISKPPVLLSPRRPERRIIRTPIKSIQRSRYTYRATRSLDRNHKLVRVSEFSPLDERVVNAPSRRVTAPSTAKLQRPLTSVNLTSRLRAEASVSPNKLASNEDKGSEIKNTEERSTAGVVPKKSVRFQLPDENPLECSEGSPRKDGLGEIKQLLLEVLGRQRRMEEDIKLLKLMIQKK